MDTSLAMAVPSFVLIGRMGSHSNGLGHGAKMLTTHPRRNPLPKNITHAPCLSPPHLPHTLRPSGSEGDRGPYQERQAAAAPGEDVHRRGREVRPQWPYCGLSPWGKCEVGCMQPPPLDAPLIFAVSCLELPLPSFAVLGMGRRP